MAPRKPPPKPPKPPKNPVVAQLAHLNKQTAEQTQLLEEKFNELIALVSPPAPTKKATKFNVTHSFESEEDMGGNAPIGGPVPPGKMVALTITSQAADGSEAPIDGEFIMGRSAVPGTGGGGADDGHSWVEELAPKSKWQIFSEPPSDTKIDSKITFADSDNLPAGEVTIDWDGPVTVPEAAQFGITVEFVPMLEGKSPKNTKKK